MERTSSLDLFRGSDAFSTLAFLDGHEADSGHIAAEGLQPSPAVPVSMPVSSLHMTAPSQRPPKLLHTSRLAPGFSAWPQTASNPYTLIAMHQPATAPHTFLPFGTPATQQAAGTADCQADSFAALLADDTAVGFADDCFRRESDLYLSQDRALPAETAQHEGLHSNADEESSAIEPSPDQPTASIQPAAVASSTQPAATESMLHDHAVANTAPVTASAQPAPLQPPDIASASQGVAATQPPGIAYSHNLPTTATEDDGLPDAHADRPAADAHTSCTEPQALQDQLQRDAGDTQAVAPTPTQLELQTLTNNRQEHTAQASAGSSPVAMLKGRDGVLDSLGASTSFSPKLSQQVWRPSQHSAPSPAQVKMSLDGVRATNAAADCTAQASTGPERPDATDMQGAAADLKADLPDAALGNSPAAQGDCQLQRDVQVQAPPSQQQKLGNSQDAVERPKLAVQDYQLPLPEVAKGAPTTGPQTRKDTGQQAQPVPMATVKQDAHSRLPQDASTSQQKGGSSGMLHYLACIVYPPRQKHMAWMSISAQLPGCLLIIHMRAAIPLLCCMVFIVVGGCVLATWALLEYCGA